MPRIIIHCDGKIPEGDMLRRVEEALPVYRQDHPDKGQRLTCRLGDDNGKGLLIYSKGPGSDDCVAFVKEEQGK